MNVYQRLDVVEVLQATAKAVEVEIDHAEAVWLPRSQIHPLDQPRVGQRNVDLRITTWIAKEKGIGS